MNAQTRFGVRIGVKLTSEFSLLAPATRYTTTDQDDEIHEDDIALCLERFLHARQ